MSDPTVNEYKVTAYFTCGDDPLDQWFVFGMKYKKYGKWGKVLNPDVFKLAELVNLVNKADWIPLIEGVLPSPSVIL